MPIDWERDDKESFGGPPNKEVLEIRITSNDESLNVPALKDTIISGLEKTRFTEDAIEYVWEYIEKMIKDNPDKCGEVPWSITIELKEQPFNLKIQIYPTWDSWKHIRDERNRDVV